MTIPGKGGRPRKWRSDADRVRAFRARQRGEDEPPTVAVAFDDGDALAAAWEQIRLLGEQLDDKRRAERSLQRELNHLRGELNEQETRLGWLRTNNESLREQLVGSKGKCSELERVHELTAESIEQRRQLDTQVNHPPDTTRGPSPTSGNRAQRRQAAKNTRRRP